MHALFKALPARHKVRVQQGWGAASNVKTYYNRFEGPGGNVTGTGTTVAVRGLFSALPVHR